jgi:SAM-dependent methyltransferase
LNLPPRDGTRKVNENRRTCFKKMKMRPQRTRNRFFNWLSSRNADAKLLEELQERMIEYYSLDRTRDKYQVLLGNAENSQPQVLGALVQEIVASKPNTILELGCGSGWILDHLVSAGVSPECYIGAELSQSVIDRNRARQPQSKWIHLTGYEVGVPDASVDVAFSYFVIEHCVYPEKHLNELFRIVRPGGRVFLVCPDFVRAGILPSQFLGITDGNASELLKQGKLFSAAVGLYDSRVRLPKALKNLNSTYGPFVINISPRCLVQPEVVLPDVDAVYLAGQSDFEQWCASNHAQFRLPRGNEGAFRTILFCEIRKS